jgi:hypothetical protein
MNLNLEIMNKPVFLVLLAFLPVLVGCSVLPGTLEDSVQAEQNNLPSNAQVIAKW